MSQQTKAELIEVLAARQQELKALDSQYQLAKAETRRVQDESKGDKADLRECKGRLSAIRHVVAAMLKAKHGVGVNPKIEWSNGRDVEAEETCEDIRLLRHIHDLAGDAIPF